MFVLVTYDINVAAPEGAKRLRRVAKQCCNYGIRVQNSVFECIVDAAQFTKLKHMLLKEIDREKDSLRFYLLGDKYKSKVEHYGSKDTISVEEPLVL
ncbi:MAG: CRISPR-associated endonuclease Cas2 [Clostridium sp.]|nr:CRISPR-associated endonuclease Cas2 [Clostridium sp.]